MIFLHREVYGMPGAQGSKRHVGNGVMVESSKRVKPWRDDVRAAFLTPTVYLGADTEGQQPIIGPLVASITFWFDRPKSHYRANGALRADAPEYPTGRHLGDIDKLLRSTFDAIVSAGVIGDDSQFVKALAQKRWADQRTAVNKAPGATITIYGTDHPGSGGQW